MDAFAYGPDPMFAWSALAALMIYLDLAYWGSPLALAAGIAAAGAALAAWADCSIVWQAATFAVVLMAAWVSLWQVASGKKQRDPQVPSGKTKLS